MRNIKRKNGSGEPAARMSRQRLIRAAKLLVLTLLLPIMVFAQTRTVTGTVTDGQGEVVVGATVAVKGTSRATMTDGNGGFSVQAEPQNVLKISFLGYKDQEVAVGTRSVVNVTLEFDAVNLEEVVSIGYGVQKKSDITGAMSRVSSKTIEERPVQNALQAMQGKATGVDITSNTRPGEVGVLRVRGNRSITASNEPLYVVDGIPLGSAYQNVFGSFGISTTSPTSGAVSDINPADIESIEILKDASATAIYGVRGSNGVVLITTKKGRSGRATINYEGSATFTNIVPMTKYMNAGEQLDYNRQAAITGGTYNGAYGTAPDPDRDRAMWLGTQDYMNAQVARAYQLNTDGTPVLRNATPEEIAKGYAAQVPVYDGSQLQTTEWGKLATRIGLVQSHLLSLSAGSDKATVYTSIGYLGQDAPMKDQNYKRYTANINGEIKPTKWFKSGLGLNVSHAIQNYGMIYNDGSNAVAKDSYGLAMQRNPWTPAYNEDGSVLITNVGDAWHNIVRDIDQAWNEYRSTGARFTSFAEITFLPWLKFRTNLGAQYRNSRNGTYIGANFSNPFQFDSTTPGVAYNNQATSLSWALENLLFIDKTFNDIHKIGVTVLQSAESARWENLYIRVYESYYPTAMWYNVSASNNTKYQPGSAFSTKNFASYMARFNYGLMDRYLITLTGRRDGSSVLAEEHKWDNFGSVALAWRMEQEKFIENISWINQMKLRAGYGEIGNAAVNPYQTKGSMTSVYANIPFGKGNTAANTTGAKTNVIPNPDLTWERTASTNFGLDFSILNNRIGGSIEYYVANTSNLLMNRTIPAITGYAQITTNVGKTQNKGFEVTLNTVNVKTRDFMWQTDWSFAINREKITELAGGMEFDATGPWKVGQPINVFFDYKYDRIWQNTPEDQHLIALYSAIGKLNFLPGQYKIVDQDLIEVADGTEGSKTVTLADGTKVTYMDNGFGKFNDDDKVFYQKTPKWTGGLTNTLTYKNWDLSCFAYFRFGSWYYGLTQTMGRRVETDIWSPENTDAKFAQPTTATRTNTYDGARNYTQGNMVIVRNISLQYTVPKQVLSKIGVSSAQVYAQVLNPFIFGGELVQKGINPDDITGWDDNRKSGGQTNNTVINRSFVLGLRVGF